MISKMLGAFKFSEHDRLPNLNILNAQIKRTCALTQMEMIEVESAVRVYHVYQSIWTPLIGETLVCKRKGGMLTTDTLSISTCYKFRCTEKFNYQENNVF